MNNQQLPKPRVNYPATHYQEMAKDFIYNNDLSIDDVPDLVEWRKHLRDLRNILTGARTEKGVPRTLPSPSYGICRNLHLLNNRNSEIYSIDLISGIAEVWPVYEELFAEGYVLSPLYPIPDFVDELPWKGKGLRFRLSLISFAIRLLTAAINQLKGKTG